MLLSANQKRATLNVLFGSVVPHFYHTHQGKDPGALFELRMWAAILRPTFQFDNTGAPGPSKFADTVSDSLTKGDKPCDE